MTLILYLIFAHLLADFVLQPNRLIAFKMRSFRGVLLHSAIHFALMTLFLAPVILQGYYWLLAVPFAISALHFFLDQIKVTHDKKHPSANKVIPFLLDQLLHLTVISAFFPLLNAQEITVPDNTFYRLYANPDLTIFLSLAILVTYTYDILRFQSLRSKNPKATLDLSRKEWAPRIIILLVIFFFSQII